MWLKGPWQISPPEGLALCRWKSHWLWNSKRACICNSGFLSLQPLPAPVSVYSPRSLIILIEIESSYFHELYLFASHQMIIYEQKREEHQNMKVSKQTACEVLSFQYLFFGFFLLFCITKQLSERDIFKNRNLQK